jgi:hypothetical protein
MPKKLLLLSFAAALFVSCAVKIPNVKPTVGTLEFPGVGAIETESNTGKQRRLTVAEWIDFLYAQPERPDPKNPGKMLPAKGPAVCVSSIDYQKNDTALAQLCVKAKCTYEVENEINRIRSNIASGERAANPKGYGRK